MSRSTEISVTQSFPIRRSRTGLIAVWGLQIGLATLFLLAGGSKLAGAPPMVALFDAIGVGQWFRYVTGLIEVTSAVALLVPSFAPLGALLLASTMVGAIATHLFVFPHPYTLHLGSYSVHSSAEALTAGERHIRELKQRLDAAGDRRTEQRSTPVFRG